jgi:hypothetical protein
MCGNGFPQRGPLTASPPPPHTVALFAEVEARLRSYVAGAIIPWINPDSPDQVGVRLWALCGAPVPSGAAQ